ncbi:MAG: ABC transporter substrate-binding protein [Acidobacteria bacterium]|nr:ABC transporter substrate-binding protein [Acidobacteriota bacterium]
MRRVLPVSVLLLAVGFSPAPGAAIRAGGRGVVIALSQDLAPYRAAVDAFRAETGSPVVVMSLKGDVAEGAWVLREIREQKPDAVLTVGSLATEILAPQIPDIPVVFCMAMGVSESVLSAKNVSGISLNVDPETQFRALRRALPGVTTVGVVFDPAHSASLIEDAGRKAKLLGLDLIPRPVSSANDVPGVVRDLVGKVQALWLIPDSTCFSRESFQFVLNLSLEVKVPLLVFSEAYVSAGALLSLSPDYAEIGRQAARMLRRVNVQGALAGDRVEAPEHPRLVINRRTEGTLNLSIAPETLRAADRIVE